MLASNAPYTLPNVKSAASKYLRQVSAFIKFETINKVLLPYVRIINILNQALHS